MRAAAPGKLVLSGAYSVLEGQPAIVTAVSRYVVADGTRPASFLAPEVVAAVGEARAPFYDVSALREGELKLGLGSSAAIVVASLSALEADVLAAENADQAPSDHSLATRVFEPALVAHRKAQGGGSGIDVAAAAYGGTLVAVRGANGALTLRPVTVPSELVFTVWFSGQSASTAQFLAQVRALASRDPALHRRLLDAQGAAARDAVTALDTRDGSAFVEALRGQLAALTALGDAAGIPIVTAEVRSLRELAAAEGAVVLPSGAGGGDVAIVVGVGEPSTALTDAATAQGLRAVPELTVHARGVHATG